MKVCVNYTVRYHAYFHIDDNSTTKEIHERAGDIDIPEGGNDNSVYQEKSFEIFDITNTENDEPI